MFATIADSLRLLRPRSLARTRAAVEGLGADTRELHKVVESLIAREVQQREALAALGDEMRAMRQQLELLSRRESQLRAIARADVQLEHSLAALTRICDLDRITAHVNQAIERAELRLHPFPYVVVEDLFPADFYAALLRGLPPAELFADRPVNKQHLNVPFAVAPAYSRRVWHFLVYRVMTPVLQPALIAKFRAPLETWITANWPQLGPAPLGPPLELKMADGRIMLRRRGYHIRPHRDPKWGFLTGILYLARDADDERWGTTLLDVDTDDDAPGAAPYWIAPERCHAVADVPFRRNSLLMFLNSTGAHTARIPEDAEPADLERYIYQFRIGPTAASIGALRALLSPGRQALWEGKLQTY